MLKMTYYILHVFILIVITIYYIKVYNIKYLNFKSFYNLKANNLKAKTSILTIPFIYDLNIPNLSLINNVFYYIDLSLCIIGLCLCLIILVSSLIIYMSDGSTVSDLVLRNLDRERLMLEFDMISKRTATVIDLRFSEGYLPGHSEPSIIFYDNCDNNCIFLRRSFIGYNLRAVKIGFRICLVESDLTPSDFIRDNGDGGSGLSLSLRSPSFSYLNCHGIRLMNKTRLIEKPLDGRINVKDIPYNHGIMPIKNHYF